MFFRIEQMPGQILEQPFQRRAPVVLVCRPLQFRPRIIADHHLLRRSRQVTVFAVNPKMLPGRAQRPTGAHLRHQRIRILHRHHRRIFRQAQPLLPVGGLTLRQCIHPLRQTETQRQLINQVIAILHKYPAPGQLRVIQPPLRRFQRPNGNMADRRNQMYRVRLFHAGM